jgi:4-hydroxybenzoyl-CoA thioesterase
MAFEKQIFAHFHLCDPAGILFYGNYGGVNHQVIEDYIVHLGFAWSEWFENPKFGVPLRKLEIDYLTPVFVGRSYKATAEVLRLGTTSMDFQVQLFNSEGQLCTKIRTTHVFFNFQSKLKMQIPDDFRRRLLAGKAQ